MAGTTPPKGRPTPGRRDRAVAVQRSRSRGRTKRLVWAVLAVAVIGAVLVIGSGTGGDNVGTTTNVVAPLLLVSGRRRLVRALRW